MISQEHLTWISGIVFSLAVHAGLFLNAGAQLGVEDAQSADIPLTTRLNFIQESKPQPVEEIKPEPVKPKPKPKPVKPKPVKQEKIIPLEPEPETVQQQVVAAQPKGQPTTQIDALFLKQQQQMYMHELLTHIEGYKFYPRAARRRGIEGEIRVSFTLLANGQLQNLQLDGEQSVLRQAAQQAMEEAVPLPLPPSSMTLPRRIDIGIVYSLKH